VRREESDVAGKSLCCQDAKFLVLRRFAHVCARHWDCCVKMVKHPVPAGDSNYKGR
jgi:hypothetical protein